MTDPTLNEAAPVSERRRWLLAGAVGAGAGLAGGVFAWKRFQPHDVMPANFWELSFPSHIDGAPPLLLTPFRGKPLLVNFWATWCPPCVEELPLLNRFYNENKANGWQMVGLAVDKVEPVKRFLTQRPLDFPVGMAGMEGIDLARSLGNEAGGLPFTVVFGTDGRVLDRKIGQVHEPDLKSWLKKV
ncbi:TlpA family protein disulfide reductase [Ottowia thiooxydans]|uniref:TlpA family protein disulfide reductase n=1 Tax=Ottowia thiooxydans TaxID=219182 RepID=UPI000418F223|nr:TlpA disulfide reductase family protein [Ottowia thiooxydans]